MHGNSLFLWTGNPVSGQYGKDHAFLQLVNVLLFKEESKSGDVGYKPIIVDPRTRNEKREPGSTISL
jgi:hypothetical protein